MEPLLARYLDGELTEAEAATLLERAESDPRMARALTAYEAMLDAARGLSATTAPPGFADRVLDRIAQATSPRAAAAAPDGRDMPSATGPDVSARGAVARPVRRAGWAWLRGLPAGGASWAPAAALAAVALVVFAAGLVAGRLALAPAGPADQGAGDNSVAGLGGATTAARTLLAGTPWIGAAEGNDQRLVRLVYVPRRTDVQRVTVAGSFNGWDPEVLQMQRAGGVFVAMISLPPGAYEYMFVEDDQHWVTDPLALQTRDDGFGNANAVLDLTL